MGQENISNDSSDSAKNSKDAFFDPKPKPKMIRVLTVLAYVLSVSMAAIFLSIYYIFMWRGEPHLGALKNSKGAEESSSGLNLSQSSVIALQLLAGKIMEDITDEDNITYSTDFTQEENTTNEYTTSLDTELKAISVALTLLKNFFNFLAEKMSYKATNGIKLTKSDSAQWKTASLLDTSVKLAGEEAKDRLYEPKHKKKLVRVLTVVAYVFFVSLAAIMLSLYYVFLWNGDQKMAAKYVTSAPTAQMYYAQNCKNIIADMQQQITALESDESLSLPTRSEINTTTTTMKWQDDYNDSLEDFKKSMFIKKLLDKDRYEDNY